MQPCRTGIIMAYRVAINGFGRFLGEVSHTGNELTVAEARYCSGVDCSAAG